MTVPALPRSGGERIVFKNRGVVDQHAKRSSQRRRSTGNKGFRLCLGQQVGLEHLGAAAHRTDLGHHGLGPFGRGGVVDSNVMAARGEVECHLAPQSLPCPGDKRPALHRRSPLERRNGKNVLGAGAKGKPLAAPHALPVGLPQAQGPEPIR